MGTSLNDAENDPMNLELFTTTSAADPTSKAADAAASVAADALSDIPRPILVLESAYRAEIALRTNAIKQLDAINAQLKASGFDRFGEVHIGGRQGIDVDDDALQTYVARVERYAVHAFSKEGAPFKGKLTDSEYLDNSRELVRRRYLNDGAERDATQAAIVELYSPINMWRELAKQFDPAEQLRAANMIAADRIRSHFGFKRGAPPAMKIVKGRIEVAVRVYTEARFSGARELSSGSSLPEFGAALHQVMLDAGCDATFGLALSDLANELKYAHRREVISRERVDLGDGVDVVMGFDHFKFYFPQDIASRINMFLAEFPEEE